MDNRFTVFGVGLVSITISYGFFLIGWAIIFSLVTDSNSITSWIPAFLGLPILLGGVMTLLKPEQIKIWMHISMLFGLLTLIGGLDFFRGMGDPEGPFANPAAGFSKLMLLLTGLSYSIICASSFISARVKTSASGEE
tara:strand:+ start:171 stop:584 length:414 start_codon:yes stop_codon:yes gene_type:complete